jgi:hypothetical protein
MTHSFHLFLTNTQQFELSTVHAVGDYTYEIHTPSLHTSDRQHWVWAFMSYREATHTHTH